MAIAMSKIHFNDKDYIFNESYIFDSINDFQSHLSTKMNGAGAVINFNGVDYNIDSAKLQDAQNDFVAHLRTIAGTGEKVVVNGVEYFIDSNKVAGAVSEFEALLGKFDGSANDGEVENGLPITWDGNTEGLLAVTLDEEVAYYKVSDMTFTDEQIKNMSYLFYDNEQPEDERVCHYIEEWDGLINGGLVTDDIVHGYGVVFVRKAGAIDIDGIAYPEVGVYFIKEECSYPDYYYLYFITSLYINGFETKKYQFQDVIKQGDYEYTYLDYESYDEFVFGLIKKGLREREIECDTTNEELLDQFAQANGFGNWEEFKTVIGATTDDDAFAIIIGIPREAWGNIEPGINGWAVKVIDKTKTTYETIPEQVDDIPVVDMEDTFRYCSALVDASNIVIPSGVTKMYGTFAECPILTTVPDMRKAINVKEMRGTFSYSTSLTTVHALPDNVEDIYAIFEGCTLLKNTPTIPNTVTDIGGAFYGCKNVTSISFEGTVAQWNAIENKTNWNYQVPATFVQCLDGTVSLNK